MQQLTASIQELTNNPMYVVNNVQYDPVAIMADNQALFYCVNEKDFLEFLSFKQHQQKQPAKNKKSIYDFAGILKNKTNVRLTVDELNEAIAQAGANAGMQGLEK